MADFSVREVEGMRQVVIRMQDEKVRARRGALSNMYGNITLTPRLPTFRAIFRSMFTSEARIRPEYDGSGTIHLQPSLNGFHTFDVAPEELWILEPGVFWAAEGSIQLGLWRDPFLASLWAGDGLFNWKTTMHGPGSATINTPGPVECVEIKDAELRVQGRLVLGRTSGLQFTSQRSARFPRNFISGQQRLRVFSGTGKLLVSWTPYWNQYMFERMTGENIEGSIFE